MRFPFVVAIHRPRPLTKLQCRKREKLLQNSRSYRECLKRQRRLTKRRGNQRKILPKKKGRLLVHLFPMSDPVISIYVEAIEALDAGTGKPHQQLMLELEVWKKVHQVASVGTPSRTPRCSGGGGLQHNRC